MPHSPWFAAAASLLIVLAGSPVLIGLGYLVYAAKTPQEKRHPATFVSGTVFLLSTLFAAGFMALSGFLANLGDGVIDAIALLTGLFGFPVIMSAGTRWLLRRIDRGRSKPTHPE